MRVKPATVFAATALVIAVLGTSPVGNAAWKAVLPNGSVGTAQLKKNAVTSVKVKNGTLLKGDFKAGQLPVGPAGPTGPAGPAGAAGSAGAAGATGATGASGLSGYEIVEAQTPTDSVSPKFAIAACSAGKKVVGGGAVINNSGYDTSAYYTYPNGATGWYGGYKEDTATAGDWWGRTYAICVTG
jgi:hypothetical protein